MNRKRKIFIFILFCTLFQVAGSSASALEVTYPPVPGAEAPQVFMQRIEDGEPGYEQNMAFPLYLKYFYHLLLMIGGFVCFAGIVRGGVTYMISSLRGSVSSMKRGMEVIWGSILGVTIILSSFILLKTIDPNLLVFRLTRPPLGQPDIPEIPEQEQGIPTYVEIPYGGLIENVKEQSEIVKKEADDLWRITSVKNATAITITETSMCLQILINECDCGVASDCGETNVAGELDTERCTHGCEDDEDGSDGCQQDENFCRGSVDPCNFRRIEGACTDENENCIGGCVAPGCIPTEDLCNPSVYPDIQDPRLCFENGFGMECLDQTVNLGTDNLRDAINNIEGRLQDLIQQARIERMQLLAERRDLETMLHNLEAGESAMNISHSTAISYQNYASIEEKETDEIWPYIEPQGPVSPGTGDPGTGGWDNTYNGECLQDMPPRCFETTSGGNPTLACVGNDYRCGPTDTWALSKCDCRCGAPDYNQSCSGHANEIGCTDPPSVWQQPIGNSDYPPGTCCVHRAFGGGCSNDPATSCCPPRQCDCSGSWTPASEVPAGGFIYNGVQYTDIPSGGVYFQGPNI